jgi:hypothetical protein
MVMLLLMLMTVTDDGLLSDLTWLTEEGQALVANEMRKEMRWQNPTRWLLAARHDCRAGRSNL